MKGEALHSISCPGLQVVSKPVLTISCIDEPLNIKKRICVICGKETQNSDINISDVSIHQICKDKLTCSVCHCRITKKFVIKNGHVLHLKCRNQILTSRCFTCGRTLENSDVYEWKGMLFHDDCFMCSSCHQNILSKDGVHESCGLPLCNTCYAFKERKCVRCNEPVDESNYKKYLSNGKALYLHDFCAVCIDCNTTLSKNNFVYEQNKPICRVCWAKGLSHECQECHEPVLLNNIMDYHGCWHNECIKCIKCHQSMKFTGVNFEKDQMFCDECLEGMRKHCGVCGLVVDTDPLIRHQTMFHHQCFKCHKCRIFIGDNNSDFIDGKLYCISCSQLLH